MYEKILNFLTEAYDSNPNQTHGYYVSFAFSNIITDENLANNKMNYYFTKHDDDVLSKFCYSKGMVSYYDGSSIVWLYAMGQIYNLKSKQKDNISDLSFKKIKNDIFRRSWIELFDSIATKCCEIGIFENIN